MAEDLRPEGESNKWNEKETHVFKEERDKNKDGFLNAEEVEYCLVGVGVF